MDNILIITVLTIFVTAFIGTVIKYRLRDKCLRDFRGYLVNLEYLDGRRFWGKLKVFHNGLELIYPDPLLDPSGGHLETSTLVYKAEMGTVRVLRRFHDELSLDNQQRREREIERTYNPNLFRRTGRVLRNTFNLLRDAFGQAVSQLIGAFKARGTSSLLSTQDARINSTAQQFILQGNSSYEPMLERHIGQYVVLDLTHNGITKKNVGILKDYSESFVTLLNVPVGEEHDFNLAADEQLRVNRDFDFEVLRKREPDLETPTLDATIVFKNRSRKTVELVKVESEGFEELLNARVAEGQSMEFDLKGVPFPVLETDGTRAADDPNQSAMDSLTLPPLRLWIRCRRFMDIIVPRSVGTIRFGAIPSEK